MNDRPNTSRFIVSAGDLLDEMNSSTPPKLLDASWYLPAMERDAKAEFAAGRIPGAQFFDIDEIADENIGLPHMLPSAKIFAKQVGQLGIAETDAIVVYDGPGIFSSARVWWALRTMGAPDVRILGGGFDGWRKGGLPVETGPPATPDPVEFNATFDAERVRDYEFIAANLKKGETLVLDARPWGRFTGEEPEPREGLRSGHIPGSRSLPGLDLVEGGTLLPLDRLAHALHDANVTPGRRVCATCGSGVTAAIISLALESIGQYDHSLYDGSWTDWAGRNDSPIAIWK